MIYTTLLLSLAANGLWFNPVYENFIAPRKKRVELGKFIAHSEAAKKIENENLGAWCEWEFPTNRENKTLIYWKEVEVNFFARKPFNCLLCFGFWFAFMFFAIHSLFCAEAITVAFVIERLASCFAVSFLTVNVHKIVKLIPTKI
jgi:hypothetical protein